MSTCLRAPSWAEMSSRWQSSCSSSRIFRTLASVTASCLLLLTAVSFAQTPQDAPSNAPQPAALNAPPNAPQPAPPAASPAWQVLGTETEGLVKTGAPQDPWRTAAPQERLPANWQWRGGLQGVDRLTRSGTLLELSPVTHLEGRGASLALLQGDLFATTAKGQSLVVIVDQVEVTVPAESEVLLQNSGPGRHWALLVVKGKATVSVAKQSQAVAAQELLQRTNAPANEFKKRVLEAEELQASIAWRQQKRTRKLGELTIAPAFGGKPQPLPLVRYHMNVVVRPPLALVQLDQAFFNPDQTVQEGTYQFQLPRGASVCRFAMYVSPTKLMEGEIVERQQARRTYDSIVRRNVDPGILEEIAPNLFRMQVFPIPAKDVKRVLLDFTVPLDQFDDVCRLQLPMLSNRDAIMDFQLQGTIHDAVMKSVHSPTHPNLEFTQRDETATTGPQSYQFLMSAQNTTPQDDFSLVFKVSGTDQVAVRSYSPIRHLDGNSGRKIDSSHRAASAAAALTSSDVSLGKTYRQLFVPSALLQSAATAAEAANKRTTPTVELVLAVDNSVAYRSSGDDRDQLARRWQHNQALAQRIVRSLPSEVNVRVVSLDSTYHFWGQDWLPGGTQASEDLAEWMSRQVPLGEAPTLETLSQALSALDIPAPDKRRVVLVLSADNLGLDGLDYIPKILSR
ncbi:MAG: VIT and vWA domain-containing protein, partial [Planctomycetota bacterium]